MIGLNEYYTNKKCPQCGLFVAQVTHRRFYCLECHVYHHRDVMAAENMANIAPGYLENQERPEYLQPVAKDGSLPWMKRAGARASSTIASGQGGEGSTSTSNRSPGRRKRSATTSSATDGAPGRQKRSTTTSSLNAASHGKILNDNLDSILCDGPPTHITAGREALDTMMSCFGDVIISVFKHGTRCC